MLSLSIGGVLLGALIAYVWSKKRPTQEPGFGESPESSPSEKSPSLAPEPGSSKQNQFANPGSSSWWEALKKSRDRFLNLGLSQNSSQTALREALEEACLVSDLGVANTQEALNSLDWSELSKSTPQGEQIRIAKIRLAQTLEPWMNASEGLKTHSQNSQGGDPLDWLKQHKEQSPSEPIVLWFVGVNGVGKTTSIAKLANELKNKGYSVLLGAGDTFRAAAGEQLEVWASRIGVDIVKGSPGSDSSAVLFDAVSAAKARKIDFVLCDSAGRLHNQSQLMEALQKNKRVMQKALPSAPHETLLVLDANTGQNMISQADQFLAAVGVTGLVLTKLDGTARGGAVVAVARKTQLPIRRLGLGEKAEDFVPFNASEFSKALLGIESLQ